MMAFIEKIWRRMVEMIVSMQKDMHEEVMTRRATSVSDRRLSAITSACARPDCDSDARRSRPRGRASPRSPRDAVRFVAEAGAGDGALLLFLRHTSASLVIQENADPDVRTDLVTALDRLAPADAGWVHDAEGPDDMPAHVKAMVTGVSLHVPVIGGRLALGTWQGIYLVEHRARPHRREMVLQFIGSRALSNVRVEAAGFKPRLTAYPSKLSQ